MADYFEWTDEAIDMLRQFLTEGFSAFQIASKIGGLSRNAVIGKANRLGLSRSKKRDDGRDSRQSAPTRSKKRNDGQVSPEAFRQAPRVAQPARRADHGHAGHTLCNRPAHTCPAILGEVFKHADPPVCGAPSMSETVVWCSHHFKIYCPKRAQPIGEPL